MTKREFKTTIDKSKMKADKDKLRHYLKKYNESKTQFMGKFKSTIESSTFQGLSDSKLDSITYDYIIPKGGRDTRIKWPESKTYKVEESTITVTQINFHLTSREIKYRLVIDFVLINGRLRLHEETGTPMIYTNY